MELSDPDWQLTVSAVSGTAVSDSLQVRAYSNMKMARSSENGERSQLADVRWFSC